MEISYRAIGKRIRAFRKRSGLSQIVLAEKVDRSPTYISYIESGIKCMSLETFILITNALNVSADEILVDNLLNTVKVSSHSFASVIADCDAYEQQILLDVVAATKASLRAHHRIQKPRR